MVIKMKKNIGMIVLGIVIVGILGLIIYTIFIKDKAEEKKYNIVEGQVIDFKDYDLDVTVLNIAEINCLKGDKKCKEQIEVLLSVNYNDQKTYYNLKSIDENKSLIKNSNYYIILDYKDDNISIDIKDKKELNKAE